MWRAFENNPAGYIIGFSLVLSAVAVSLRYGIGAIKFFHRMMNKVDWIDHEMREDSGESLKDLARKTDKNIETLTISVNKLAERVETLERRLPNE